MSTQRVFTSVLPRLRVASSKNATTSLAQQAQQLRCYSRPTATLRPSGPARSSVLSSAAASAPRRVCVPATSSTQPRTLSTSASLSHGHVDTPKPGEELWVTFIDKEGVETKIAVCKGDNLLDIAQAHDLEMEGACGGSCACSTCHVIVEDPDYYDKMPEPDDDENDMLDLAFGLTETSRLGCQVIMTPELDGLRVKLPSMTRNLQSSDFN
ncbi:Putative adrenodoxin, mitochondrial precursor [Podospora comata]|uniref:Adrenodoxin, mitochondrial n=1 Tax=Podospora comata TaxID=48703 RepID=A0ABY6S2J6_PODCO|nr:Putative adrenodoxin, mitochondrial precursor [Podospora comata]